MASVDTMAPICACCGSEDVLICSREALEFDGWVDIHRGIAHAFAVWLPEDQGWVVTGAKDSILHRDVDGEIIAFRDVRWLEDQTGEMNVRRYERLVDLIDCLEASDVQLGVAGKDGDFSIPDIELRSGLQSFEHYCCSCRQNSAITFIELPELEIEGLGQRELCDDGGDQDHEAFCLAGGANG